MKCPSCGFDSFLDTERCKKCGHTFGLEDDDGLSGSVSPPSPSSPFPRETGTPPEEVSPVPQTIRAQTGAFEESPINTAPAVHAGLMLPDSTPIAPTGTPPVWKAELDERVERFRRRRARARGASDSNPNLEFDFEEPAAEAAPATEETPEVEPVITSPEIDFDLATTPRAAPGPVEMGSMDAGPPTASVPVHEAEGADLHHRSRPVEFVLDTAPEHRAEETGPAPFEIHLAPMSQRLWGGLIDAAVLMFSAGVFAVIFWRSGGHVSSHPLTLGVLGFVVVFIVVGYFGAFTASIAATPGLLWMGIEVRSWLGGPPTLRQSFWRAFGCLVSASALLLGFIWALLDNESLTWHDRMSETYLAPADVKVHHLGSSTRA